MQEELMELALKRNFLMPSNEIYGHTAGFYDYGVVGAAMKRKVENAWRELFLWREGYHEIESASVLPEKVLKASGHVDNFGDPMVQCRKCKMRVRADKLVEEALKQNAAVLSPNELDAIIKERQVKCKCGGAYDEVVWFNLMFETSIGAGEKDRGYLRPETAQGIFVDFPRVFRALGAKLPLGVGQIGKSFRNEIAPRQALMRLREFTQMELEYFFNPAEAGHAHFGEVKGKRVRVLSAEAQKMGEKEAREYSCEELVSKKIVPNEIMAYFMLRTSEFYGAVGLQREKFWFRQLLPNEMPHYSKGNFDVEVQTSYGVVELMGLAYRTDFDLSSHARMSSKDLSVHLEGVGRVVPHACIPSHRLGQVLILHKPSVKRIQIVIQPQELLRNPPKARRNPQLPALLPNFAPLPIHKAPVLPVPVIPGKVRRLPAPHGKLQLHLSSHASSFITKKY